MPVSLVQAERFFVEGLIPRGLVHSIDQCLQPEVTQEGLSPFRITINNGFISSLEPINITPKKKLKLILPRLVEPHAHLDKVFTWNDFPNLTGTYEGALNKNFQEHKLRNTERVRANALRALNMALRNGLRAIRSHVDSFGQTADETWDVLLSLRKDWIDYIELQLVALVPIDYWNTGAGIDFAKKIVAKGGLMGGVVSPPFGGTKLRESLDQMLRLANNLGCGIDLHIDEASSEPAKGIKVLLNLLEHFDNHVPITCSHLSSMSLLQPNKLIYLAECLAKQEINVVALPLTNSWILGRASAFTPLKRPLAPIRQLQQAGVKVALGWDNVQDPWLPLGNFDPLRLIGYSMPLTQMAPWQRLGLAPFTTAASELLELSWDGVFSIGSPADLIVLDASNWVEALSSLPERKVMIKGGWLDE